MSYPKQNGLILAMAIGVILSVIAGFLLEGAALSLLLFGVTGLVAGALARFQPPGAERFYWGFVLLIVILAGLSAIGLDFSRWFFILPIVFVASYFVTRLVLKLAGLKPA